MIALCFTGDFLSKIFFQTFIVVNIYTIKFAVFNFLKIFSLKITFKIFIKVEGTYSIILVSGV